MSAHAPMPADLAQVYEVIRTEVTWLHGRWKCYRQLFAVGPKRIDLLNEAARTVFFFAQDTFVDHVLLTLCKLTDPAGKGLSATLSLEQLQRRLDSHGDAKLASRSRQLLDSVQAYCEPFKVLRNKQLAHLGLSVALKTSAQSLPEVSRQMIEDALLNVREYLNGIERHYRDSEWGYDHFIMNGTDGDALVHVLRDGLRYEELVQAEQIPYDDWLQSKWNDA